MTPADRDALLARLDERTARMDKTLHGNGSPGSSHAERLAKLETQNGIKYRTLWAVLPSLIGAAAAHFGVPIPLARS